MRGRTLAAVVAVAASLAAGTGVGVPQSGKAATTAAGAPVAAAAAAATGQSTVAVPADQGTTANLRTDACVPEPWLPPPQNPNAPYNPCGVVGQVANGSRVIMRCWTDTAPPPEINNNESGKQAWESPRWFYVTAVTSGPESAISGFIYSALIPVDTQTSTPNCSTLPYVQDYPFTPGDAQITIANRPTPDVFTVELSDISFGPATLYCHVGSGYPTGGTVRNLGTFNINFSSYDNFTIPVCGTGNQWVGIIASNGIIRYSNQVTLGGNSPPPTPAPIPTPTELPNDFLEGTAGNYAIFASPGLYVGASVAVDGLGVQNYGSAPVTVDNVALGVTSPEGQREEYQCADEGTRAALTNVTIAPGGSVTCDASFSPDEAGTWTYDLDWQGSDAQWRYDYLYAPMTVQVQAVPRPANDDFANAQDITQTGQFSGDDTNATAEAGEPGHLAGYPAQNSVWFKFTASITGRAWVNMDSKDYSATAVAAYSGGALADLTPLASWDGNNDEAITFKVTAGHVYYIAVDDYGDIPGGVFAGTYTIDPIARPGNDNFAEAQKLVAGTVYKTDFTDATVQAGEPAAVPDNPNTGSVWYAYRPGEDVTLTLSSPGGNATEGIGVFTGSSLTRLTRREWTILSKGSSPLRMALAAHRTYYIVVANYVAPDPVSGIPQPSKFQLVAKVKPKPPYITTKLPVLHVKVHARIQLHAADGTGPFRYKLVKAPPLGHFTVSASGLLTAAPAKTGTGQIVIEVFDSEKPKASSVVKLHVTVRRD